MEDYYPTCIHFINAIAPNDRIKVDKKSRLIHFLYVILFERLKPGVVIII